MKKSVALTALTAVIALSPAVLAGGAGAPVVGASGLVQPATVSAVVAALRDAGYQVKVNAVQPDEDPSLSVTSGDYQMDVWLSDCKNAVCSRVTASMSWDYSDAEDSLDTEMVNEWNGNYYSQAYIYEGAYYLDSTLFIRGGFTKATVKGWLADYLVDVQDFEAELP